MFGDPQPDIQLLLILPERKAYSGCAWGFQTLLIRETYEENHPIHTAQMKL